MTKGCAIIREEAGDLTVNYEDFNVEFFDGMDYEVTYRLDGENAGRLKAALEAEGLSGSARELILAHFGPSLDRDSFGGYCDRRGIRYELFTWLS